MKNTVTKQQIDELLAKSEIKVETVYDKVTVVNWTIVNKVDRKNRKIK